VLKTGDYLRALPTFKESRDEPDRPRPTRAFVTRKTRRQATGDRLALALATCGVGLIPFAPGTWGSAVGAGLYLLWRAARVKGLVLASAHGLAAEQFGALCTALALIILTGLALAGIWAATRAERRLGRKDPGAVVIDEVVGQLITYLPLSLAASGWMVAAGFLLFRAFDIWKPYPIRRLEALESGLGIMADDVLAGAYAATVLSLLAIAA